MIKLSSAAKANLASVGIVGVFVVGTAGTIYLSYKAGQLIGRLTEKPMMLAINKLATYL